MKIPSLVSTISRTNTSIMSKERSILPSLIRRQNNEEDRFHSMYAGIPRPGLPAYITGVDDDNESGDVSDARSIESYSTTATVDDNPGTGRVLDTYFFQPAGRKIERLAMRFIISRLHPWRISAFINRNFGDSSWITPKRTLEEVLQKINGIANGSGPAIIAGLKSLVRQTQ